MPNEFVTPGADRAASSYRYQKFPMILYRDGAYKVVKSEEEETTALDEGWGTNPEHKSPEPELVQTSESDYEGPSPNMLVNFVNNRAKRKPGRPRTAKA